MDGKHRLIAIKDSQGKIAARGLLRILLEDDKPVLFLNRIYPNPAPTGHTQAIFEMAKKKARELGIPLYVQDPSTSQKVIFLQSLGGPAPFEYADGAHGIRAEGKYTLPLESNSL